MVSPTRRQDTDETATIRDGHDDDDDSKRYEQVATALYNYEADPDNTDELSFSQGDVLEIAKTSGRWWPPRKKRDGQIGMVPRNHVCLEMQPTAPR
jgi:SHO1 osmosensor